MGQLRPSVQHPASTPRFNTPLQHNRDVQFTERHSRHDISGTQASWNACPHGNTVTAIVRRTSRVTASADPCPPPAALPPLPVFPALPAFPAGARGRGMRRRLHTGHRRSTHEAIPPSALLPMPVPEPAPATPSPLPTDTGPPIIDPIIDPITAPPASPSRPSRASPFPASYCSDTAAPQ